MREIDERQEEAYFEPDWLVLAEEGPVTMRRDSRESAESPAIQ